MKNLLIVEDDKDFRESLAEEFINLGYTVVQAARISEITNQKFNFAIVDLRLKGEVGLHAIPVILETSPECKIVMLTGYGNISSAVEAIKAGAANFLVKPASVEVIELAFHGRSEKVEQEMTTMPKLSEVESQYIDFVLCQNEGNISRTAKVLGLHRQSLQRKLKKYP